MKRLKINKATKQRGANNCIRSLAFSPDGKLLAAGTRDGEIYLRELPKGKLVFIFSTKKGMIGTIASVAFSSDGKRLAALSCGRLFQIWQVRKRQLLWEREYDVVNCFQIAFSADGRKAVGAGYSFLVCDASNGKVVFSSHPGDCYSPPGGISSDGSYVAVITNLNTSVKVCRTSDLKEVWQCENHLLKLRLKLFRWAMAIEERLDFPATKLFPTPNARFAFSFALPRDKKWLACGFDDESIRIWSP